MPAERRGLPAVLLPCASSLASAIRLDPSKRQAGEVLMEDLLSLSWDAQSMLGRLPKGRQYLSLWLEFEEGKTPEARLLRELDRLEMALQACAYEREGLADLARFFESADKALSSPALRKLFREILAARPRIGRYM